MSRDSEVIEARRHLKQCRSSLAYYTRLFARGALGVIQADLDAAHERVRLAQNALQEKMEKEKIAQG